MDVTNLYIHIYIYLLTFCLNRADDFSSPWGLSPDFFQTLPLALHHDEQAVGIPVQGTITPSSSRAFPLDNTDGIPTNRMYRKGTEGVRACL
jgi:hypothetical protein